MPALKTKTVQTLEAYISVVEELRINRKGPLWYRGCGKLAHKLEPSLYRHKGSKTIEDFIQLEKLLLAKFKNDERAVFFIDPPYTAGGKRAGSRLYTHSEVDHVCLFSLCKQLRGDFLLTYDNADEVRALALRYGFDAKPIAMKNIHHAEMNELLIGRDLRWMEASTGVVA